MPLYNPPSSGGSGVTTLVHPGYVASTWYGLPFKAVAAITSGTAVAGSIYCTPFYVHQTMTVSQLGVRITTLSTGNSSAALQAAIYANDTSVFNRPGLKVDSLASPFATGAATSVSAALNANQQLTGNKWYWFCVQPFDTTVKWAAYPTGGNFNDAATMGAAAVGSVVGAATVNAVSTTGTFGTFPSNLNGSTWTEQVANGFGPVGGLLVASVP